MLTFARSSDSKKKKMVNSIKGLTSNTVVSAIFHLYSVLGIIKNIPVLKQ